MEDCIFCCIVDNVAAASVVYSDERTLAFMDVQPVNLGHVLVILRGHALRLAELDEETGAQLFRVAMRVAQGVRRSELKVEGVSLLLADGEAAGQEVPHVHLHVIPRFRGMVSESGSVQTMVLDPTERNWMRPPCELGRLCLKVANFFWVRV